MADDKVQFAVSMTPLEMVGASSEGSAQNFVVATEAYGTGGGSGEVTGLDIINSAGAGDGYADGTKYYQTAAAIAEDNATTDILSVLAAFAADQYVTIARLKAGEAIVLPIRSKATVADHSLVVDGTKILVASTDGTNIDGTIGVNTIAVEFVAIGA